jgi:hypothetical protein
VASLEQFKVENHEGIQIKERSIEVENAYWDATVVMRIRQEGRSQATLTLSKQTARNLAAELLRVADER